MSYIGRLKKKKKQNIMYLCEVVLNLNILMMKNYDEASIPKKCIPHFNLNTKNVLSHHMTILGTNSTNW